MHFFVILLIILLGVLVGALVAGGLYLYYSSGSSSEQLLKEITFSKVDTSFTNGIAGDTLWPEDPSSYQRPILAKLAEVRTFLVLAEWLGTRVPPITQLDLPFYFTLPEVAVSVKTYVAAQLGILPHGSYNNLIGELISPTHVAFKFAVDETPSDEFFTGHNVVGFEQELAVIIVYTVAS